MARALRSGRRGRGFKSHHPDHSFTLKYFKKGCVPFIIFITAREREALEFQAIGGGKNAWFPRKWAIGKNILVEIRMFLRYK